MNLPSFYTSFLEYNSSKGSVVSDVTSSDFSLYNQLFSNSVNFATFTRRFSEVSLNVVEPDLELIPYVSKLDDYILNMENTFFWSVAFFEYHNFSNFLGSPTQKVSFFNYKSNYNLKLLHYFGDPDFVFSLKNFVSSDSFCEYSNLLEWYINSHQLDAGVISNRIANAITFVERELDSVVLFSEPTSNLDYDSFLADSERRKLSIIYDSFNISNFNYDFFYGEGS